jgi:hypothetical protein
MQNVSAKHWKICMALTCPLTPLPPLLRFAHPRLTTFSPSPDVLLVCTPSSHPFFYS